MSFFTWSWVFPQKEHRILSSVLTGIYTPHSFLSITLLPGIKEYQNGISCHLPCCPGTEGYPQGISCLLPLPSGYKATPSGYFPQAPLRSGHNGLSVMAVNDIINQTICFCFFRIHIIVTLSIAFNHLIGLACVCGQDFI